MTVEAWNAVVASNAESARLRMAFEWQRVPAKGKYGYAAQNLRTGEKVYGPEADAKLRVKRGDRFKLTAEPAKKPELKKSALPEEVVSETHEAWTHNDQQKLEHLSSKIEQFAGSRSEMGVAGLRKVASALGVPGGSKANKDRLISGIKGKLQELKGTASEASLVRKTDWVRRRDEASTAGTIVDSVRRALMNRSSLMQDPEYEAAIADVYQRGPNAKDENKERVRAEANNWSKKLLDGEVPPQDIKYALDNAFAEMPEMKFSPMEFENYLQAEHKAGRVLRKPPEAESE